MAFEYLYHAKIGTVTTLIHRSGDPESHIRIWPMDYWNQCNMISDLFDILNVYFQQIPSRVSDDVAIVYDHIFKLLETDVVSIQGIAKFNTLTERLLALCPLDQFTGWFNSNIRSIDTLLLDYQPKIIAGGIWYSDLYRELIIFANWVKLLMPITGMLYNKLIMNKYYLYKDHMQLQLALSVKSTHIYRDILSMTTRVISQECVDRELHGLKALVNDITSAIVIKKLMPYHYPIAPMTLIDQLHGYMLYRSK